MLLLLQSSPFVGSHILAVTVANNQPLSVNQTIEMDFLVTQQQQQQQYQHEEKYSSGSYPQVNNKELCCFWNFTTG